MSTLTFTEQGSTPSTPTTGKWKVYAKADGIKFLDDTGTEGGMLLASDIGSTVQAYDANTVKTAATQTLTNKTLSTGTVYESDALAMIHAAALYF